MSILNRMFSKTEKQAYYEKRAKDSTLTKGQRKFAQKRLNQLNKSKSRKSSKNNGKTSTTKTTYTDAQKAAYNAGIGYGAAKANKRVKVKDENKRSFRNGYNKGKTQRG